MKNLIKRSLTGILYVAVIVVGVLVSQWTLYALAVLLTALGILEFERLKAVPVESKAIKVFDTVGGLLMVSIAMAGVVNPFALLFCMPLYLIYITGRMLVELYSASPLPITSLGHSMLSQLYIALPLSLMVVIGGTTSPALLLAMFIMIWLNDTGAFCVGSMAGRHKLFERISPKKTWEGFAGGLLFTVGSAFIFKYCFGGSFPYPIGWLVGMGLIVSVFGTWGDLIESMMKRAVHVKDSGHLLPGHGGILDRIDSLLVVSPMMVVYIYLSIMAGWI